MVGLIIVCLSRLRVADASAAFEVLEPVRLYPNTSEHEEPDCWTPYYNPELTQAGVATLQTGSRDSNAEPMSDAVLRNRPTMSGARLAYGLPYSPLHQTRSIGLRC